MEAGCFSMPLKRGPVECFNKLSFWCIPWGLEESANDCCLDPLKMKRVFLPNEAMLEGACVFHCWKKL